MNRVEALFKTPGVAVARFDHPADQEHADGEPEYSTGYTVSFVERGSFDISRHRQVWRFRPGDALISYPEVHSEFVHEDRFPSDVCLSISFEQDFVESALGRLPSCGPTPRVGESHTTAFLLRRIRTALRSADPMVVESAALDAAVALLPTNRESTGKTSLTGLSSWHSKQVETACELMGSQIDRQHSLSSVARGVGMSPFHFSRIFKQLVGQTPHQYLIRARLAHASRRLRAGFSVTDAAFASGFENLSHFIRLFKRRFGVAPRGFAQLRSPNKSQ
jgi:AraC family transcriptional regulator